MKTLPSLPLSSVRPTADGAVSLRTEIFRTLLEFGQLTHEFDGDGAKILTASVLKGLPKAAGQERITAEEVEEVIERILLQSPHWQTAKNFILARQQNGLRQPVIQHELRLIDEYLDRSNWKVKENSNMSYSLQGLNQHITSAISKDYWLHRIYSPAIRAAHEDGDMHIHDLGLLSVYCVGWDLADLLRQGFCGVAGKLEAAPPKHFRTALGQIVNFFYTLQGEAAGAQAFSNFDTLLAPFIRRDGLTFSMVKQALQEFIFNINIPTRVGFQTPFTNITLDLFCPQHLAKEPVLIGGELQEETYGEFQKEMDLFNRAFFEVMVEGDAKGRIFTFPIPTINISKDFDWDNPVLDGLWDMTGKYGIPYFSNFVNSDMKMEDVRSMCCRLRIDNRQLERRGGGLFGANPLTGSIGIVTLNLPRLAHQAKDEADFFDRLGQLMDTARDSLEIKRSYLEKMTKANLYPYISFYLRSTRDRFGAYWKNHFSTIGIVGMNEACINALGTNIASNEGKQFAIRVLDFMRERLVQFQRETGNHYNLEATPAEGTSFRLAKKDRARFPSITVANGTRLADDEAPFYTNSIHLPVDFSDDLFEILDHQDELQTKFTGGTVVHLFLGERIADRQVVKNLVKKITHQYRLPYFSLTPTFSICPDHGYLAGEVARCPHCDARTEIYSRVVGYIRPIQQWNDGKRCEFKLRKTIGQL